MQQSVSGVATSCIKYCSASPPYEITPGPALQQAYKPSVQPLSAYYREVPLPSYSSLSFLKEKG